MPTFRSYMMQIWWIIKYKLKERKRMKEGFCRWHDKPLREVAEWQQDQCKEAGKSCDKCQDLVTEGEEDEQL